MCNTCFAIFQMLSFDPYFIMNHLRHSWPVAKFLVVTAEPSTSKQFFFENAHDSSCNRFRTVLDGSSILKVHGPFGRVWPISGSRLCHLTREGLSALSITHDSSAANPIAIAHARSLELDRGDDPDVGLEVGVGRDQ